MKARPLNGHESTRISITDSFAEAMYKISEGNPGALSVLVKFAKGEINGDVSNPLTVFYFDSMHIYGSDIWLLYKDCCREDINEVNKVLRAWQLAITTEEEIKEHIRKGKSFNLPSVEEMFATEREGWRGE